METCSVDGCERLVRSRGMCNRHYLKARRGKMVPGPNRTERVLKFVEECLTAETDSCLVPPFKYRSDYPSFTWKGVNYKVGWLVLEGSVGPRPKPEHVMRHFMCGNSRCCNPRHLCWGTEKENAEDRMKHGREPDRAGEKNPRAKLTRKQVLEIRRRYRRGRGPYDPGNGSALAAEYGVTRNMITNITRGENWG